MKVEVALYLLKKLNVPNSIKVGLVISYIVFESFDVKARAERLIYAKTSV